MVIAMTDPERKTTPHDDAAVDVAANVDDAADVDDAARPRVRQSRDQKPSWSQTMNAWAPVAAGVLRAGVGLVAFAASLLVLPVHPATPFLTGVGLVMLVGGVFAVMKFCKDEPTLTTFGRGFPLVCVLLVVAVFVVVGVEGVGAFAPDLRAAPAPPDDGAVRFSAPEAG
jgi:hypothetical protein